MQYKLHVKNSNGMKIEMNNKSLKLHYLKREETKLMIVFKVN